MVPLQEKIDRIIIRIEKSFQYNKHRDQHQYIKDWAMKGKTNAYFSKENQGDKAHWPRDPSTRSDRIPLKISLIVPIYNEADGLSAFLDHLNTFPIFEMIVVDGGSSDQSTWILSNWEKDPKALCHRRFVVTARGRGRQMNAGAKEAKGDVLLFLHADTRLPADALGPILETLRDPACVGGAFRLRIDSSHLIVKMISLLANLRSRFFQLPYGDQGYFVRQTIFEAMAGYADLPLMEDVEFVGRLKRRGKIVLLNMAVKTSARRWKRQGYAFTSLRNATILCLYFLGVSPHRLAQWYQVSPLSIFCKRSVFF